MDRTIEVHRDNNWVSCEMRELCVDDVFRMFEFDGTPVSLGGMWLVLEPPFPIHDAWEVNCEPIVGYVSYP